MSPTYGGNYRFPARAQEKHDDDVGGGFVEQHPREDPLADWEEPIEQPFCQERTRS
jgi:hypothetical protein